MWRLSRTLQLKAIRGAAVRYSGHAADGSQFIGVDVKTIDDVLGEVESQHFSKDQVAAVRFITHGHDLHEPAFHLHAAFAHPVGFDDFAGNGSQAREFELIYLWCNGCRALIHFFSEVLGNDIQHELTSVQNI